MRVCRSSDPKISYPIFKGPIEFLKRTLKEGWERVPHFETHINPIIFCTLLLTESKVIFIHESIKQTTIAFWDSVHGKTPSPLLHVKRLTAHPTHDLKCWLPLLLLSKIADLQGLLLPNRTEGGVVREWWWCFCSFPATACVILHFAKNELTSMQQDVFSHLT